MKPKHIMEIRDYDGKKKFFNKYEVIDEILLHSELKDRKVVIMSIIGEYRKGKSFLLDYCLRFMYANYASVSKMSKPALSKWIGDGNEPLNGFSWKHGRTPDTKGILFWPDVFLHDSPSGEKMAIIIMDTQGLFELGSTQEENARIFGLSTLISSVQIINIMSIINEGQIEYLDMATSLTSIITQKKGKSSQWKPFQKLLFLIRDWSYDGIGYEGGVDYFKEFLDTESRQDTKAQAIRKNIHGSFDSIKCFLLNNPGSEVLKPDFKGEWARLEPSFVENLKLFIESILLPENLIKKSILGRDVTCLEFRDYIYGYLDMYRDTKLPEIDNVLQMTIDNQMKAIVAEQFKTYQTSMNANMDLDRDDFESFIDNKHKEAKRFAITMFVNADKLEDKASNQKYMKILNDDIEGCFGPWRESIMREYKRYSIVKDQMKDLSLENSQHKESVLKLEEEIKKQTQESARAQQEFNEKIQKQAEMAAHLNKQVKSLNIVAKQKDEEVKKIRTDMESKTQEYAENLRKQQETQQKQIEIFYSKLDKVNEDRIKEHERNLEAQERNQEKHLQMLQDQVEREERNRIRELEKAERQNEQFVARMMEQQRLEAEKMREQEDRLREQHEHQEKIRKADEKERQLARDHQEKQLRMQIEREREKADEERKEREKELQMRIEADRKREQAEKEKAASELREAQEKLEAEKRKNECTIS